MGKEGRSVERTCVACRKKGLQQSFVRYVVGPDQSVFVDYRHRLPGRGAYTCIDRACIEKAVKGGGFARAFRQKLNTINPESILAAVTEAINQRILGLLGIARKAGAVISGTSLLQAELKRNTIGLLLIADDAAERSLAKLLDLVEQNETEWVRFGTREEIGKIIGRDSRICAGITDKQFAEVMALEINRLQKIAGEN